MNWLDNILNLDPGELWVFLGDVLRNPTSNLLAFVLILGGITVVMLLLIMVLLLVFSSSSDDEEYEDEEFDEAEFYNPDEPEVAAGQVEPAAAMEAIQPAEESKPPRPRKNAASRLAGTLAWLLIVAVVWVGGGWVSSQNTLCTSCHLDDSIHKARIDETGEDPHDPVMCVSCHESTNDIVVLTGAVPGRAVHFVAGMITPSWAAGYGTPVTNSNCLDCHASDIEKTTENTDRGIKMSHAEPVGSKARCGDCHVPQPETGIIGKLTVGMDPCLRCHNAEQAPADCSYCHTKDIAYAMQVRGTLEPKDHVATLDCGGCHDQTTCDACHGTRLPHSAAFIGGGHARAAVEDVWNNNGQVCGRCHLDTRRPCTKCHAGEFPQHGSWFRTGHQITDPYNNGCDSCHGRIAWDAQRNYCGLCHDRYSMGMMTNAQQD